MRALLAQIEACGLRLPRNYGPVQLMALGGRAASYTRPEAPPKTQHGLEQVPARSILHGGYVRLEGRLLEQFHRHMAEIARLPARACFAAAHEPPCSLPQIFVKHTGGLLARQAVELLALLDVRGLRELELRCCARRADGAKPPPPRPQADARQPLTLSMSDDEPSDTAESQADGAPAGAAVVERVTARRSAPVAADGFPSLLYRAGGFAYRHNLAGRHAGGYVLRAYHSLRDAGSSASGATSATASFGADGEAALVRIKWEGCSAIHQTWELLHDVQRLGSYRAQRRGPEAPYASDQECVAATREAARGLQILNVQYLDGSVVQDVQRLLGTAINSEAVLVRWASGECTWELLYDLLNSPYVDQTELCREVVRYCEQFARNVIGEVFPVRKRQQFNEFYNSDLLLGTKRLEPHEIQGVNIMAFNYLDGRNTLLADQVGLGKTIQAIGFIHQIHYYFNCWEEPVLVIAPLSLARMWYEEAITELPGLKTVCIIGTQDERRAAIEYEMLENGYINYNVVITTPAISLIEEASIGRIRFSAVIIDEAHMIKNFRSKTNSMFSRLDAGCRLLLTATPIQNCLTEFISLLNYIDSSTFGPFLSKYNINEYKTALCSLKDHDGAEESSNSVQQLINLIRPYIIRRNHDILKEQLPTKGEYRVYCNMTTEEHKLYEYILEKGKKELCNVPQIKISLANALLELRKVCSHPCLLEGDTDIEDLTIDDMHRSGKAEMLVEVLEDLVGGGHKVIVFSQFLDNIGIIGRCCDLLGIEYRVIMGETDVRDRSTYVCEFQSDGAVKVIVISTRAAGQGLNLHAADRVVMYDTDFNPQVDEQAVGRAYRIGQGRRVEVYILLTRGTVEERVYQLSREKVYLDTVFVQAETIGADRDWLGEFFAPPSVYEPHGWLSFRDEVLDQELQEENEALERSWQECELCSTYRCTAEYVDHVFNHLADKVQLPDNFCQAQHSELTKVARMLSHGARSTAATKELAARLNDAVVSLVHANAATIERDADAACRIILGGPNRWLARVLGRLFRERLYRRIYALYFFRMGIFVPIGRRFADRAGSCAAATFMLRSSS